MTSFETAVTAIIGGDTKKLEALLTQEPELIRARSSSEHRSTLLHYVAANGIEDELQQTPPNAVEVARILLDAGAEVDALCETYGGGTAQTTLNLLVSSEHPAAAGVQTDLVKVLCDAGAAVDGIDGDGSPLATALGFGYPEAVAMLVSCGACTGNLLFAAAAGRLERVRAYFDDAGVVADVGLCETRWFKMSSDSKIAAEQALVYASMCGQAEVMDFLLSRGVDINANPPGTHVTGTALHTVAAKGDEIMVRLLLDHGADTTIRDSRYDSTPLGWAEHCGHPRVADLLREAGLS